MFIHHTDCKSLFSLFPFYFDVVEESFEVCVITVSGIIFRYRIHMSELLGSTSSSKQTLITSCHALAVSSREP
jgi:hypothetical protein